MQCTSCPKDNECPGHESEVQDRAKAEVVMQQARKISQHKLTFSNLPNSVIIILREKFTSI
jgi:hypothetical protein